MTQRLIENTIPVLAVRDLDASITFYRDILGFDAEWRGDSVCSLARDGCSIMLQRRDEVPGSTVWIGLESHSIYDELQQSGAKILQPPTWQPWAYEMKIADPDGNTLWLGADPAS